MTETRIFDLFDRFRANPGTVGRFKLAAKEAGKWKEYTSQDYHQQANLVSYGLLALGFKKGDKIATLTNNRPEWNFMEMGMSQIGVVHVPIHVSLLVPEITYILNHAEARMVVVSDKSLFQKLSKVQDEMPMLESILTFDQVQDATHWSHITSIGIANAAKLEIQLEELKNAISEDMLLTLIYTSGTTGTPKGVMLSHKNIMSNTISSAKRQHLNHNHKVLSFLPLSHIFEHMVSYQYQYLGISVYYAESMSSIAADIKELQIDGFITVPRMLESVYEKIISKAKTLSSIKRSIFAWAVRLTNRFEPYRKQDFFYSAQLAVADKLVYSKWRQALSPNISFIGCGGAALQPRLARLFWAAKLPVFEGYGLTETSPILTVNYSQPGEIKIGSVGPILEGVTLKIAEDGEILAKGPNIMLGYYKDPEQTAEVIDEEGWFHTGDIGQIEDGKFLKITDRKKEIFKISNGKYIAPQQIENKLKESFYIQQTMVVGENQKFASALIIPNFSALSEWAKKHKVHFQSHAEMIKMPQVIKHFEAEIKQLNKKLNENEQIKKIILLADEWTPTSGELTATLKLRRKKICEKYQEMVEAVYATVHTKKAAKVRVKSNK
ncbi:MAG: long-chain fatty acid--CoA ligase [Bacteroidales bacterium]|nr:long-chain fatty acid--CoA ligase [Bacteroidales bacterium]MDZ4203971.1 long-chain fatty acid--CoA ligase [Bacteroidales bacterium]